jgi:hypothetical protein
MKRPVSLAAREQVDAKQVPLSMHFVPAARQVIFCGNGQLMCNGFAAGPADVKVILWRGAIPVSPAQEAGLAFLTH